MDDHLQVLPQRHFYNHRPISLYPGSAKGVWREAAFFTCLIPTTVGILGPSFLVLVTMGLLFIPLSLFLAFNFRTVWAYLLIFLFTCFLLLIHAPSAIGLIIVLTTYILLNIKGNFKHSLGIALALLLPFLIIFPWISDLLLSTAKAINWDSLAVLLLVS